MSTPASTHRCIRVARTEEAGATWKVIVMLRFLITAFFRGVLRGYKHPSPESQPVLLATETRRGRFVFTVVFLPIRR
jgi:hypothetical protein